MALLNPSFEHPGALPGEAEHWTLTAVTSLEEIAGFGAAPEDAWEDFERWFELLAGIEGVAVVLAFFDGARKGYEAFESGWDNALYLLEMPPALLVTATFDGKPVETCESGWSNVPYAWEWAEVASAAGVFGSAPRESFEAGWRSNQAYAWSWGDVTASDALFDEGAREVEGFEGAWTPATTQ